MKIEKLKPGMTVFEVRRQKMGNTTMNTVAVFRVYIVSIDLEKQVVEAEWNTNAAKKYWKRDWSRWRENEPLLIKGSMCGCRLATREEIKARKQLASSLSK